MRSKFHIIIIILFLTGCQFAPYADDLLTEKPNVNDVVGTYIFEKQTITNDLTDKQIINSKIILRSDSSFYAVDIPNFSGQSDFYFDGLTTSKGKWHISTNGGVANLSGGTDSIWGMELDSVPNNLKYIDFLGHKPPYKLIITYGDPDVGAVMIFRKSLN